MSAQQPVSDQRSRVNTAMRELNLTRSEVERLISSYGLPPIIHMTVEQGDALLQLMQVKSDDSHN